MYDTSELHLYCKCVVDTIDKYNKDWIKQYKDSVKWFNIKAQKHHWSDAQIEYYRQYMINRIQYKTLKKYKSSLYQFLKQIEYNDMMQLSMKNVMWFV